MIYKIINKMSFITLNAYNNRISLNNSISQNNGLVIYNPDNKLLTLDCQNNSFCMFQFNYLDNNATEIINVKFINYPLNVFNTYYIYLIGNNVDTIFTVSDPVPYNVYYSQAGFIGQDTTIYNRICYATVFNDNINVVDTGDYYNNQPV